MSCGHRSCNRCQNTDTSEWLERQRQKLLPVDYFMVTFTLPEQLRSLAWQHQRQVYDLLFKIAAETLKQFGSNDKHLDADLGMTKNRPGPFEPNSLKHWMSRSYCHWI